MSRIERATARDRPALEAIRAASLPERAPRLLEYAIDAGLVLVARDRDSTAANGDVCPASARVAGYSLTVPNPETGVATVLELAVAPGHRGHGYGTALLEATVERLDGHGSVELETAVSNERARRFYRERGFEVVRRLPDRYADGDGLLLARGL